MNIFRRPQLFLVLTLVNIAIFLAMWVQSGFGELSNTRLLAWGANFAPLTLTGEPWRLLTSAFLHGGWSHLLLNMSMLVVLGSVMEHLLGARRFGAIYLLSALGGSLASAFWHGYHRVHGLGLVAGEAALQDAIEPVVSVGASGALMGLAGAAGAAFLFRVSDDEAENVLDGKGIMQVIGINLVSGLFIPGIDQAAHCGGLVAGFLAGLVLCRASFKDSGPIRGWLPIALGAVAAGAMLMAASRGQSDELLKWKEEVTTQSPPPA